MLNEINNIRSAEIDLISSKEKQYVFKRLISGIFSNCKHM